MRRSIGPSRGRAQDVRFGFDKERNAWESGGAFRPKHCRTSGLKLEPSTEHVRATYLGR